MTAPSARVTASVMALVVVIWGLGAPVTKLITAPPLVAVSMRFWITVPLLWSLVYVTGRRISSAQLRSTVLAGILFGANHALVFASLKHASVAVVSVLLALQPGVVLLVAGPLLGEWATRWHIAWTVVGVGGVAVVILGGNRGVSGDPEGLALAVAAMLTFCGYYVINRRVRATTAIEAAQWMAGATLFAGLTVTPIALATSSVEDYRQLAGADWIYLGFMAVVVGVVGHTAMSWAHRFIPAARSSLYLLAMNVIAVGAAWPIHDEPVTIVQAAGGLVVLGAVAAVTSRPGSVRVRPPVDLFPEEPEPALHRNL
ncbi:MAG: DMT family transporter [Acidimicrobiia bacterium]